MQVRRHQIHRGHHQVIFLASMWGVIEVGMIVTSIRSALLPVSSRLYFGNPQLVFVVPSLQCLNKADLQ